MAGREDVINLKRPDRIPPVLSSRGDSATQQDCDAYVDNRAAYDSGELKFKADKNIYGSPRVRKALSTLQSDKCCYCESKPSPTSAGRIDHFRPNGAVRQDKQSNRLYPGYYWLAYRWDNLVLACETCNRRKSDYFPLEDPGQRARNHLDPLDRESPLLLNPYTETDLSEHLTFNGSACEADTERGRVTVAVLGLNRPGLQEERQCVLNLLEILYEVVRHSGTCAALRRKARLKVDSFARRDAPYSAMARDYLSAVDENTDDIS